MDRQPVSWGEINQYAVAIDLPISPWERRLIHRLSSEYVAESRAAEDEGRPAPWQAPLTEADRDAEERALIALLG